MSAAKSVIHQMAIDAWSSGVGTLVLCLAIEGVERGSVSRFFNLLWLLLFIIAATLAVMATNPGAYSGTSGHRYSKGAKTLLQLGSLALAAAAWLILPRELSVVWRSLAAGGILLASLLAWPALSKNE